MTPASVGKCLCVLNHPCLSHQMRSLSCSRLTCDGQQIIAHGSIFSSVYISNKHFSTADQGSAGSERAPTRSSVKEWMLYLTRKPNFDLQMVTRILSPLHVDVQKLVSQYKENFKYWVKPLQPVDKLKEKEEDAGNAQDMMVRTDKLENLSSSQQLEPEVQLPKSSLKTIGAFEREQHDFASAMSDTHESIENFQSEQVRIKEKLPLHLRRYSDSKITSPPVSSKQQSLVISQDQTLRGEHSLISQASTTATNALDVTTTFVKHIASYLPSYGTSPTELEKVSKPSKAIQKSELSPKQIAVPATKKVLIPRSFIDRRTRALVVSLKEAKTNISQSVRLEELCKHLLQHPDARNVAVKNKIVPCLLRLRSSRDETLQEGAMEALALIGFTDPVPRNGVRILALDGGGTKGLIAIEIMKKLEEISRQRIHELFDYICGVSTGALIAIMATAFRVPLSESEEVYKEFSSQMFVRNKFVGAGKLFMSHAYYDTQFWEKILRENIGEKAFLETARDPLCPKISAVSTLMNVSRVQNFLFRNYNLPPGRQTHYAGSIEHRLWQSIRASSAAPGYYEEYHLGDYIHQDGGLLTNNPTAIAIHECQLLWPNETLQCVVSIGTGKHEAVEELEPVSKSSLKSKVVKVIQSATDTEAVHTVLRDLLKPSAYFRFNPYMSEEFLLDEIREEKWDQMRQDTEMYCRKNQLQLEMAVKKLLQPRPAYKKAADWLNLKRAAIGR